MADVINLDAWRPHESGPASCTACGREWIAVSPAGTEVLECPSCRKLAGVRFSAREVRLIQALEKVADGYADDKGYRVNWEIAKAIAREALIAEGWGRHGGERGGGIRGVPSI